MLFNNPARAARLKNFARLFFGRNKPATTPTAEVPIKSLNVGSVPNWQDSGGASVEEINDLLTVPEPVTAEDVIVEDTPVVPAIPQTRQEVAKSFYQIGQFEELWAYKRKCKLSWTALGFNDYEIGHIEGHKPID